MKKRKTLSIVTLAGGCSFLLFYLFYGEPQKKYNVVMIVSDALRADVLACYGGDAETPHISWLAENGILFKNAYSTAPCTVPSSVSMFTGNYSMSYGIYEIRFPRKNVQQRQKKLELTLDFFQVPSKKMLPGEVLRDMGYDVKYSIENEAAIVSNNDQGFEPIREFHQLNQEEIAAVESATGIRRANGRTSENMYGALNYLLHVPKHETFFFMKWFLDPHAPYDPPEKYKKGISVDPSKLSRNMDFFLTLTGFGPVPEDFTSYDTSFLKALYTAEVESIDERIGFLLKVLRQRDLLKNTYIVFTTDHGEMFGEHGNQTYFHEKFFHEELVHIPLIITGPGIQKRKTASSIVSHLDLMPTIMDLLGIEYEEDIHGSSYSSLLFGGQVEHRSLYFDQVTNNLSNKTFINDRAVLKHGFKLVMNIRNKEKHFFLYNLKADPNERKDLSEEEPGIVKELYMEIRAKQIELEQTRKENMRAVEAEDNLNNQRRKIKEALQGLGYIQ